MPALAPLVCRPRGPLPLRLVYLDDARFRRSHLASPRGRGSWLFELAPGELLFEHRGLYRDAAAASRVTGLPWTAVAGGAA